MLETPGKRRLDDALLYPITFLGYTNLVAMRRTMRTEYRAARARLSGAARRQTLFVHQSVVETIRHVERLRGWRPYQPNPEDDPDE